jgi:two-component system phosphate regulon sensor histidine kinase PhoR
VKFLTRLFAKPEAPPPPPEEPAGSRDDRFDALARALPLGVVMLGRDLRVAFANPAAAAIFGFDRRRAIGTHLIAAVPSVDLERRAQAALEGEVEASPLVFNAKSVNRSYAVSIYPVIPQPETESDEDEMPMPEGVLILAEDHTELLALERARQEFLTNVSHELRTPLASVKLMLETVIESPDQEASAIFLPQALGQVDRLVTLVGRLLEQARTESGALVLDVAEIDLESVAQPIVSAFQHEAAANDVNLELRALRPVVIEGDGQRLSQIFVNLIDNALRYTPEGGSVTVTIDAHDGYAVIKVRDTGIGIPYKDLPFVFERFYVVDRSRTRAAQRSGGAGLGLSIVKQIAEAHGGSAEVESRLGRSTTFTVRVPFVAPAAKQP